MKCDEIRARYPNIDIGVCCPSCHDDEDCGFGEDLWFIIDGKDTNVCCAVARAFDSPRSWTKRGEMMEFQTRSHNGEIKFYTTLHAAFNAAMEDAGIWKVSFSLPNDERVRLVKERDYWGEYCWKYEPLLGMERSELNGLR